MDHCRVKESRYTLTITPQKLLEQRETYINEAAMVLA